MGKTMADGHRCDSGGRVTRRALPEFPTTARGSSHYNFYHVQGFMGIKEVASVNLGFARPRAHALRMLMSFRIHHKS